MDHVSLTGVFVSLVGVIAALVVSRTTGSGWLPSVGLAVLLGVGLYLWARDEHKGWGDLGQGLLVSVIVAIALMAVQRDADERTRLATERRDRQLREAEIGRQKAAERDNLQVSLTMQTDLRGVALADRDMHSFFLASKNFADADMHGANLAGADLRGANLRRANLLGAKLDDARMQSADLRGAILSPADDRARFARGLVLLPPTTFRGADLRLADLRSTALGGVDFSGAQLIGADFRSISTPDARGEPPAVLRAQMLAPIFRRASLIFADFRGADMTGADLREAVLEGATFCGALELPAMVLQGAISGGARTRWPPGYDPVAHGATRSLYKPGWSELRGLSNEAIFHREKGATVTDRYPACRR